MHVAVPRTGESDTKGAVGIKTGLTTFWSSLVSQSSWPGPCRYVACSFAKREWIDPKIKETRYQQMLFDCVLHWDSGSHQEGVILVVGSQSLFVYEWFETSCSALFGAFAHRSPRIASLE